METEAAGSDALSVPLTAAIAWGSFVKVSGGMSSDLGTECSNLGAGRTTYVLIQVDYPSKAVDNCGVFCFQNESLEEFPPQGRRIRVQLYKGANCRLLCLRSGLSSEKCASAARIQALTSVELLFQLPSIEVVVNSPRADLNQKRTPILVLVICSTRELASQVVAEGKTLLKYHSSARIQWDWMHQSCCRAETHSRKSLLGYVAGFVQRTDYG